MHLRRFPSIPRSSPTATTTPRQAYGSAAMLLAKGERGQRSVLPYGTVMLHQPRGQQAQGQASDIAIKAKEVRSVADFPMESSRRTPAAYSSSPCRRTASRHTLPCRTSYHAAPQHNPTAPRPRFRPQVLANRKVQLEMMSLATGVSIEKLRADTDRCLYLDAQQVAA